MTRKAWADKGSRHARGYGWRWVQLRERILKRDQYLCGPCRDKGRTTPATEVHHILPKAQGGTDDMDNLVSTCSPCHREADARALGRRVRAETGVDGWPV